MRKCESSANDYALSIRSADNYVHMKISRHVHTGDKVNEYYYVLGSFSQPYDHIADIVNHFSCTTLPVKGVRGLTLKFALRRDRKGNAAQNAAFANPDAVFRPISTARNHGSTGTQRGHAVLKPRAALHTSPLATVQPVASRAAPPARI